MAARLAILCAAVLLSVSGAAAGRRELTQFYPAVSENEYVNQAASAAKNATATARVLLVLAQTLELELDIAKTVDLYLVGHVAAEYGGEAAQYGQLTAGIAGVDAAAAVGIATVAAINKSDELVALAQRAIENAEAATAAITTEDNSTTSPTTTATLSVFGPKVGHDGTLILYWANLTEGAAQDAEAFNETVYGINGIYDFGQNETVLDELNEFLSQGANPAIGLAYVEVLLQQLLGAIYAYQGNFDAVYNQQVELSSFLIQASQLAMANPTSPDSATAQPLIDQASTVLDQSVEAGDAANSGDASAATSIEELLTATTALEGQVRAALDAVPTPGLPPSSADSGAAAAGRR